MFTLFIRALDSDKYINRTPYDSAKPLYALEDFDETTQWEIATGYQEDENGEFAKINELVTPTLAEQINIIVMELGPCGTLDTGGSQQRGPCGSGGSGGGSSPFGVVHSIKNLTVKEHKEAYPFRSEVTLIGFRSLGLPLDNGSCGQNILGSSSCINQPNGRHLKKFKRRWIRNHTEIGIGNLIDGYCNELNVDIYVALIIFERDSWPVSLNEIPFVFPNGVLRTMGDRSDGSDYHHVLLKNKINTEGIPSMDYVFNTNAIEGQFQD